jgi:hypothetical protein
MQKTPQNKTRAMQSLPLWQKQKPNHQSTNLTEQHPLVKLFNWMRSQSHFQQYRDFEDWRDRRDIPEAKESDLPDSVIEQQAKENIDAARAEYRERLKNQKP